MDCHGLRADVIQASGEESDAEGQPRSQDEEWQQVLRTLQPADGDEGGERWRKEQRTDHCSASRHVPRPPLWREETRQPSNEHA